MVTFESLVRHQPLGRTLRGHFLRRLAERQGLGLRKEVRGQDVLMVAHRD